MASIKYGIKVGDLVFPCAYDGFTLSYNKVWSSDTGRNNNGKMIGTIVSIKKKVECKLLPMTLADAKALNDIVSNKNAPFVSVTYNYFGTAKTMTGYFGDISFPFKGTNIGQSKSGLIVGVSVDVIEQ